MVLVLCVRDAERRNDVRARGEMAEEVERPRPKTKGARRRAGRAEVNMVRV